MKVIKCTECGKQKPLYAKQMCKNCYSRKWTQKNKQFQFSNQELNGLGLKRQPSSEENKQIIKWLLDNKKTKISFSYSSLYALVCAKDRIGKMIKNLSGDIKIDITVDRKERKLNLTRL